MMRPPLPRLIQEEISLTMLNRLGKETVPDAWLADLAEDSLSDGQKNTRADLPILECSTNTVRFSVDSGALICTFCDFQVFQGWHRGRTGSGWNGAHRDDGLLVEPF